MTTPKLGAPEWTAAQETPWIEANKARRIWDAFGARTSIKDRDLTAPPGSCADGDRYLVGASPTGLWATYGGKLAIASGLNASNGWIFATVAHEGVQIWVEDESLEILYTDGAWTTSPGSGGTLASLTDVDLTNLRDGYQLYWDESNQLWYVAPPGEQLEWTPNFTADGDVYIPATYAMEIALGNPKIGTGTITFEKSTAAAPGTFGSTTLPATLEAGAWLKVIAASVTGFVALHLRRID